MAELVVGAETYRVIAELQGAKWTARAFRAASGDRFGMEFSGSTEADVVGRLTAWLEWQRAHMDALSALQSAEQAFHRTVAGSAFASASGAVELQKASLDQVEGARVRLDEVRARQPV